MQVIFKQEKFIQFTTGFKKIGTHAKNISCFSLLFNRSEIKQSGWFTSSQPVEDEITKERKHPIYRSTRITSSRITVTPHTVHHPTRLTPPPPTAPQPTHLAPRPVRPTPRTVTYTTNEVKLYSEKDDQDRTSQMMLPPTTMALVVKKPVR